MAKSKGNIITVESLHDDDYDPLAFRFLCLRAHYRSEMRFSYDILDGAAIAYRRLRDDIATAKAAAAAMPQEAGRPRALLQQYNDEISEALYDDLGTPAAMSTLQNAINSSALDPRELVVLVEKFDKVFALDLLSDVSLAAEPRIPEKVLELVNARSSARSRCDWERADELRHAIQGLGYDVQDSSEGTKVRRFRERRAQD